MKIAIVGLGAIGSAVAAPWVKAGHDVVATSRNPDALVSKSAELGVRIASIVEAVREADVILLALYWQTTDEFLEVAGDLGGKVLLDTVNPYILDQNGDWQLQKGFSPAKELAAKVPGARVVKAFSSLPSASLAEGGDGSENALVVPVCGDDEEARRIAMELVQPTGLVPLDLGGLENVWLQEPGGPLFAETLNLQQARAAIAGRMEGQV